MAAFSQGNAGGTTVQNAEIEKGKAITLKASADRSISFQWFKDGVQIQGANSSAFSAGEAGTYTVLAYNNDNCSSILSNGVKVIVKEPVIASLKANLQIVKKSETKTTGINEPYEYVIIVTNKGPETATDVLVTDVFPEGIKLKESTTPQVGRFDYNPITKTVTWKIDELALADAELRFKVEPDVTGTIINMATVTAKEDDPELANNKFVDSKEVSELKVPNVFTPNGDGANDKFEIKRLEQYPENEITILNRWGNSIYEKKNYQNDWEGAGLDEGTYFYVLKIKSSTGKWSTFKGFITLLRTAAQI